MILYPQDSCPRQRRRHINTTMKKTLPLQLPEVLVTAIKSLALTETPIWRIGQGRDHVKVELTYQLPKTPCRRYKNNLIRTQKKGAESRSKPAPPAGEWPRQPSPLKETAPPTTRTIQAPPRATLRRPATTMTTTAAPVVQKPSASSNAPPPSKVRRRSSPRPATVQVSAPPTDHPKPEGYPFHVLRSNLETIKGKYEFKTKVVYIQDLTNNARTPTLCAKRKPRFSQNLQIDLPCYFFYSWEDGEGVWYQLKGPTSKYYNDEWWTYVDSKYQTQPSLDQEWCTFWNKRMHGLLNGDKEVTQQDDMALVLPDDPDDTLEVPVGK